MSMRNIQQRPFVVTRKSMYRWEAPDQADHRGICHLLAQ